VFKLERFCLSAVALACLVCGQAQATPPRDPAQPPGQSLGPVAVVGTNATATARARVPVLTSILLSEDRRLAVINDKLVREGGRIAGMTLVRVGKDAVQLRISKRDPLLVLRLPKSNIGKEYR